MSRHSMRNPTLPMSSPTLVHQDLAELPSLGAQNLDPGASLLLPVPAPLGGCVVLGESVATYVAAGGQTSQCAQGA